MEQQAAHIERVRMKGVEDNIVHCTHPYCDEFAQFIIPEDLAWWILEHKKRTAHKTFRIGDE